jgi:hypothetical protein
VVVEKSLQASLPPAMEAEEGEMEILISVACGPDFWGGTHLWMRGIYPVLMEKYKAQF